LATSTSRQFFNFFLSAILIALTTTPLAASTIEITENCDIPGGNIKNLKSASPSTCRDECNKLESCKGFTFISGWNRCFLKRKISRKVSLKIHSGEVINQKNGRTMDLTGPNIDIPGKDLRKVPNTKTPEICSDLCLKEPKCVAFSYLDGYRDCWLKDRSGRRQTKTFSCGIKN